MFPEDVNLNILSFLGIHPRKRCWSFTQTKHRCKNHVSNRKACVFCPLHERTRFRLSLFEPFEDLLYIIKEINSRHPTILRCPPYNVTMDYPNFPYV